MTRVLVIEDDHPIRALLTDLLEGEGYSVSEAASGADALRAFEYQRPEAIVLDMTLPDMNGQQIAEMCCLRTQGAPVPILLMSATAQLARPAEQLRRFGVRGFLPKPFDLDKFLLAVECMTAAAPVLAATS